MMKKNLFCVFLGMVINFHLFGLPLASFSQNSDNTVTPKTAANGIKLNFRGVPLETVLDYLSEVAGFIIVKEANLDGRVDVWSYQPLTADEAVNLLNTVLYQKGFTAIRNGRTLTIVNRDEAKMRDLPVKTGNNPDAIQKTDEMITQIIPVRYTDAMQLIENLQPLIPEYATLTANESSNALVLTDTQTNVRRMVEIIKALDTSISSISTVQVFPLQFSDAKELSDVIEELFQMEESNNNNRRGGSPFGGFGGRGGRGGGRGGGGEEEESIAKQVASRVVAVADEQSNSLIVSAPDELMPFIEKVILEVDQSVEDITELRVFPLQFADANEMAELITELFPDESSDDQAQFAPRFGRGGFFGGGRGGGNNNRQTDDSERQLQQSTIRCVADPRTNAIIVTAAQETMIQIEQMVIELDKNPSKKQKVYVYNLEYADVENVATILRSIFEEQVTGSGRTNTNQNANTLGNRTLDDANAGTTRFQ